MLSLAMVAGEASGDLLAGLLLTGLRARWPGLQAAGIGGPRMAEQGFQPWWPHHKLAVRGYVEVLRHYREISAIRQALAARLLQERPAVFIGVDAPDFNLGLELRLKQAGIKTVHFICPSIWAWRGGRARKMAASCDHVLCLFPFEPALLQAHGVAATFVGHPLADAIPLVPPRAASRAALGLAEHDTVVAVLPGSRCSEMQAIAPAFLPKIGALFAAKGVEMRGDAAALALLAGVPQARLTPASEQDWSEEYLAPIISVKIVASLDHAIAHINRYGSHHTDAILTDTHSHAMRFLREVDSASVMVNASTRFADGFEYGLGAEIGISTDKFHARGPVGIEGLTSMKWVVLGHGETRG